MIYRRVLQYYRAFAGATLLGLLFSLVSIGLNLLKPWPLKIIVDQILPNAKNDGLHIFQIRLGAHGGIPLSPHLSLHGVIAALCLALVLVQLLWGICNYISNYIFVRAGLQALLKLRTELYAHLQRLSLKFHDARRSADSSFRVAYDSQAIQTIYNKGFIAIFDSAITLLGPLII